MPEENIIVESSTDVVDIPEKTFTQEELDTIVQKRVAKLEKNTNKTSYLYKK